MTNGISVNDMVAIKATGEIGRVVAIDDHTDKFPADLQVEFRRHGKVEHSVGYWTASWVDDFVIKLRIDEVIRVQMIE